MGVCERHFTTQLRQTGNFVDSRHVVRTLQDGLQRAVDRVLTTTSNLHDQDRLSGGDYAPANSEMVESVWMPFSIVWFKPSTATNNLKWTIRFNFLSHKSTILLREPGHQNLQAEEKTIITIRNDDVLYCARALVTAKAKVDKHPKWRSIQEGRQIQREQALLLHEEANVPFGPCGYEELVKFSTAPSLYEYQILLVDADCAFHVSSFGPPSAKQLILLREKATTMSSPVSQGLSGPVICVPTASNPTTTRDVIVVKPNSSAAPVSKKFVLIFSTLTNAVSQPPNVAMPVDDTFSETPVSKPIVPKTSLETPLTPSNLPSASLDVNVWDVSNSRWVSKTSNVIVVGT